jgi:hypothetical protein
MSNSLKARKTKHLFPFFIFRNSKINAVSFMKTLFSTAFVFMFITSIEAQPQARNSGGSSTPNQPSTIYLGDLGTFGCDSWATFNTNWPRWRVVIHTASDINNGTYGTYTGYNNVESKSTTSPRFTQTGTWYWGMQVDYGGSVYWYPQNNSNWYNMWNIPTSNLTITVLALGNPTSCSAAISGTTSTLGWTKFTGTSTYNVMIVRYAKNATPTAPTKGTAYTLNQSIGTGTVVYTTNNGTSTTNSVTVATDYDYYFYSENFSYYSSGQKVTALAPLTPIITVGALSNFGSVCTNANSSEQTFTVSGANLTENITLTPPVGFQISTTSGSSFVINPSTITLLQSGGTVNSTTIYARFLPSSTTSFSTNITAVSTGATTQNVAVAGTGINTAPTVTTPSSASVTATTATLGGNLTVLGCSNVTEQGIYYSTTTGFADGAGTKVSTTGLNVSTTGTFTQAVTGLTASTVFYYFKAFSTSSSGTAYSAQGTFTTLNDISTADFRSKAAGPANWNTAGSWEYNSTGSSWITAIQIPSAANNVLIQTGHTITMNVSPTFNSGKTLTVNGTLTAGTNTISGAGNFTISGGTLTTAISSGVSGTLLTSGTNTFTSGTFTFNSGGSQNFGSFTALSGMDIITTGASTNVTLNSSPTIKALTIGSNTTFTSSDGSARTLTITKSALGSSITLTNNGTWINGSGASTVAFSGAPSSGDARHAISGNIKFFNVTISKTSGSSNVGVEFGINQSIDAGGKLTIGNGGYVGSQASTNFYTINGNTTLEFSNSGGYNINNNDVTWPSTNSPSSINITSGPVVLNESRVASGSLNISGGSFTLQAALTINGNWTRTSGATFTPNLNAVTLSGTSDQTISITGGGTSIQYTLVINKMSGSVILDNSVGSLTNLTVVNALTLTNGALNLNGRTLTLNTGCTITRASGSLSADPTFAETVNVNYLTGGLTTGPELPTSTSVLNNLTFSNASGTVTIGKAITVKGILSTAVGGTIADGGFTITTIGASIVHNGTHTGSGSIKLARVSGDQTITGTGTFQNLENAITTSGDMIVGSNFNIAGNFTNSSRGIRGLTNNITFTGTGNLVNNATMYGEFSSSTLSFVFDGNTTLSGSTGYLDAKNYTVNAGKVLDCGTIGLNTNSTTPAKGIITINGTLKTSNSTGMYNGTDNTAIRNASGNFQTITIGSSSTIEYNASGSQSLSSASGIFSGYRNLTISGSGVKTISGTPPVAGTTTISAGELRYNPSANYTPSSNVVLENGTTYSTTSITATRTITNGTLNLNNGSATLALASGVNHTLTFANSSGVTWNGTALTITGWGGTAGQSNINGGKIIVGSGGLTSGQLAKISFSGYTGSAIILAGELVPTASTIWQGGNGASWNSAGNWTEGIPDGSLNVIINAGYPLMDVDFTLPSGKSLVISGTGGLVINAAKTLTIAGSANFGDLSVTLKSTASGTGAIGKITGTLINASNVTIERYIPSNGFRSWRLLSVPTFCSQSINESWQANTLITGTGTGFDAGGSSMLTYNSSSNTWSSVSGTDAPIETPDGYSLYVRGDRSQGTGGAVTNTNATTLKTTGTIFQGELFSTSVPAGKYGLVGNLYPSAIDFTQLTRTPGIIDNVFYLWDSKKQFGTSLGVYQYFDGGIGYKCLIPGGSFSTVIGNTTIESGQAFFVRNSGGSSGTVTFNENSKVSSNGTPGFRPVTPTTAIATFYSRLLDASGSNVGDVNVVKIDNSFSNEIDGHDIAKLPNSGENFGIQRDGKTFAIEGRQPISSTDTIYFNMWNMQQQSYKLEFEPNNLAASGFTAILQDSYLNSNTPVDLLTTTSVNFTLDANAASSAANRFRLVFKPSIVLPVSLISISANRGETGATVNWKVAAERAVRQYEVERSTNGRNFSTAGTVTATGLSNYSFADANASACTLFYRIKMVGMSGENSFSSIVKLRAGNTKPGFNVSPNPVEGGSVNLQLMNQSAGSYNIRLVSVTGQLVFNSNVLHTGGSSTQEMNLPAGTARGTYQLEIIAPDKSKTIQKLFVNTNK